MSEVKKVTKEELEQLKVVRDENDKFVIELGRIGYQKAILEAKEESIKKPLKAFVESQRVFTKQIAKSFSDITTAYSSYDYASIFKPTK